MHIALSCCRAGVQKATDFATVVTDLTTCHNTWFHPRVDQCFVATQEARRRAMRMGLKVGFADRAGCFDGCADLTLEVWPLAAHPRLQAVQHEPAVPTTVRRPRDSGSMQGKATPCAP